jgi:hypothetical protein
MDFVDTAATVAIALGESPESAFSFADRAVISN